MSSQLAILFLTHKWRRADAARFARVARECREMGDCFLAIDARTPIACDTPLPETNTHVFDAEALPHALGFPYLKPSGVVPGCTHYVMMDFAQRYEYDKYLVIEHDVEFTGDWAEIALVCISTGVDLLASHVLAHAEMPRWFWWERLWDSAGQRPPLADLKKAFQPIACYSRRGLLYIAEQQRAGWRGHGEVLIPTLLSLNRMTVADMNDIGRFYAGPDAAPDARSHAGSTLRWRPILTRVEFAARFGAGLLYHPVKEDWVWVD